MKRAIEQVQHCTTMQDVRRCVDALDDVLVPLLVQRASYMTQAARIKQDVNTVRDEARIQTIVDRVRKQALDQGGEPAVIEAIYRSMMEVCIAYEHHEFARLRGQTPGMPIAEYLDHEMASVEGQSGAGPAQGVNAPVEATP